MTKYSAPGRLFWTFASLSQFSSAHCHSPAHPPSLLAPPHRLTCCCSAVRFSPLVPSSIFPRNLLSRRCLFIRPVPSNFGAVARFFFFFFLFFLLLFSTSLLDRSPSPLPSTSSHPHIHDAVCPEIVGSPGRRPPDGCLCGACDPLCLVVGQRAPGSSGKFCWKLEARQSGTRNMEEGVDKGGGGERTPAKTKRAGQTRRNMEKAAANETKETREKGEGRNVGAASLLCHWTQLTYIRVGCKYRPFYLGTGTLCLAVSRYLASA